MSVRIMTAVWSIALPDSEKIVLLALADCANDEGLCWPSMATLAAKCSKSDRTVQAAIKSLVAAGQMSRQEVPGRGCRYIIHPTPAAASPPKPLRGEAASPPKGTTPTPEAASDKPSRTITSPEASPPTRRTRQADPKAQPTRMPDDWKPIRFADGTVAREIVDRRGREWGRAALESFRNWAANADDRVGRKRDWQRAWANWIIEQDNRDGRRTGTRADGMGGNGRGHSASGMGRTVDAGQRWLQRRQAG
ncbi:Helix-turn-helix domain-containing protein [Sphingomonas gellani]|uniref:Helix-turn-helix domain-containing protein n=1 Tax=Sphingomonas gellani TaxID=1166340 RepID=A0A1H7Z8R4_9SPHN|nr:helix-turn-helix domain-containing protein [Sphingomonas gellani]SEM54623.1 Helix-turn-helix domain-containing protein [Sphingomonas gellani]